MAKQVEIKERRYGVFLLPSPLQTGYNKEIRMDSLREFSKRNKARELRFSPKCQSEIIIPLITVDSTLKNNDVLPQ
jgi:hypothetical protein